jgi:hypothetical protein
MIKRVNYSNQKSTSNRYLYQSIIHQNKKNMVANDIRNSIMNTINRIDDLDKLVAIFNNAKTLEKEEVVVKPKPKRVKKTLPLSEAKTGIRKNVTFEQLKKEQNYKPISYEEFRAKADEIEWEHTLDELLAALD